MSEAPPEVLRGPQQEFTPQGVPIYRIEYAKLAAFMTSTKPVQVIQGPVGSGKSKLCNLKAWAVAAGQKPGRDGIRHTRGAVIRNTYPELVSTTMRTWKDTFPETIYGRIVMSKPAFQRIRVFDIDMEIDFLALDKEDDVKKLRSSEYTWAYINELQYIPKVVFDEIQSRIEMGRYPAMKDGGPTWHGLWADMNAPDDDHFIAMMTGQTEWPENMPDDEREALKWPAEWDFIMQPPGLLDIIGPDGKPTGQYKPNPAAENVKWLAADAYMKMIRGKSRAWIKSHVLNQIALVIDGDPVWPWFRREVYVAGRVLEAKKGHDLWVTADFGRKPAVLFGQFINNRVVILDEMQAFNEGAVTFAPKVKKRLEQKYAGFTFRVFGDPKGADKNQTDDRSAYDVWAANGMKVTPSPVKQNLIQTRIEAVEHLGSSMYDGSPRLLISPNCRTLIVGMEGRYCYEKKQNSEETHTEPKENNYTHLCFVAGTSVSAPGGRAPIEELRIGDEVSTPFGPRKVTATGNRVSNTVELLLSNGSKIRCTTDHPFWTERGWVKAADLMLSDALSQEGCHWLGLLSSSRFVATARNIRSMSFLAFATIAAASRATITAIGSLAESFCIALYGRTTTGQFRMAGTSTTLTSALPTTNPKILCRSPRWSTAADTCGFPIASPNRSWPSSAPLRLLLASAAQILRGPRQSLVPLEKRSRQNSPASQSSNVRASDAAPDTRFTPNSKNADFALRLAKAQRGGSLAWMTRTALALFVRLPFASTSTRKNEPVHVVAVSPSSHARVFNITVDDVHCYYAAGVLVSNCDCLQYKVIAMGEGRAMAGLKPIGDLRPVRVHRPKSMRRISAGFMIATLSGLWHWAI